MKTFIAAAILTLFAWQTPSHADTFEVGETVYSNFFCLNLETTERLTALAKSNSTTMMEMNIEMGIAFRAGECIFVPDRRFPLRISILLDTFVDFGGVVQELYELIAPDGTRVYSFTPIGYAPEA